VIEVQDIINRYGKDFLEKHKLSYDQARAYRALQNCRTAALGSHLDVCNECGFEKISYNSCRNRHCPKCQTLTKEKWIEKQNQYLLDIGYFHVVFTVPEELNPVFYQNQEVAYSLFFKAVSETLMELCADGKYLGATPGITSVLHTWGQNLTYHPHLHCIVTGGGLAKDKKWRSSRKKFFIPVKVASRKFKGKLLSFLKQSKLYFGGGAAHLSNPHDFESLISSLYRKEWVVYCKPPFKSPSNVIAYLGRYTHRVAISNNRILKAGNGKVSFAWRDYRDGGKKKVMTVAATEFIRRFMLHILPSGLRKIRHYGILSSRYKTEKIALCRKLLGMTALQAGQPSTTLELLQKLLGQDFDLCPCCKSGHLSRASPNTVTA